MLSYLKYEWWPSVKPRLMFWWWVVKFRGKKNIPPEVIFGAMAKSLERMNDNLQMALRVLPDDAPEEEKAALREALYSQQRLEEGIAEASRKTRS